MFGANNKTLLNQILKDTDPNFVKWAIPAILNWQNKGKCKNTVYKISGNKDRIIPFLKTKNTIKIEGGHHFMIVDKAKEISEKINEILKRESNS